MGINGVWDVLGEGRVVPIADYAAEHFQRHKRPLRIAVDEACWRFRNVTDEQAEKIRQGEPAANPIEAVILWRILRLMRLNIQLLFVYDGLSRPWKERRGGAGNRLEKEIVRLLHQLLDHLKIPYHQAPGEAEAECAKLQQLGIVDAVWSDDGDALMFGCTHLIKQHKKDRKRDNDHIRVYEANELLRKFDFDKDSFLMFALLAGGDYDMTGLRGCGPQIAKLLSTRTGGLGTNARHVQQNQLPAWREALRLSLQLHGKYISVPDDFPKYKCLCNYRNPNVSSDEAAHNLRALRPNGEGWDKRIDLTKLRVLLRHRFNFDTRRFIQYIAPVYLARALAKANTFQGCQENLQFRIQLKRTVKRKAANGEEPPAKAEKKITFAPEAALEIEVSQPPPEEDWSKHEKQGKDGGPWSPHDTIDCEMLDCLLQNCLPAGSLEVVPSRKRKTKDAKDEDAESASKSNNRKTAKNADGSKSGSSKPRKSKKKQGESETASAKEPTPLPPSPIFRLPKVPRPIISTVIDLDDSSSGDESDDLLAAIRDAGSQKEPTSSHLLLHQASPNCARSDPNYGRPPIESQPWSLADDGGASLFVSPAKPDSRDPLSRRPMPSMAPNTSRPSVTATTALLAPAAVNSQARQSTKAANASETELVVGETISPAVLRALRAGSSLLRNTNSTHPTEKLQQPEKRILSSAKQPEIIDLT